MKLKALALVLLVFSAMFATCFAVIVTHSQAIRQKTGGTASPSLALVDDNGTPINPNEPIDTPGGPT
jgi:hypothetical protein